MFHPSFFILFRIIPILRNNKLSEYFSILQNKQIWHVLAPAIQPVLPISLEQSPNIYLKVLFNFEHVIRYVQSQQLKAWMNETSVSIVNNKDTTTRSSNSVPMSLLLTLNIFRCTYCWLLNINYFPSGHLLAESQQEKHTKKVRNIFKFNNKNTRTTYQYISHKFLLFLLLTTIEEMLKKCLKLSFWFFTTSG